MLLQIPSLLNAAQVQEFRSRLEAATWVDGNVTSGHQSAQVKRNEQVAEDDPAARELSERIVEVLSANQLFFSAALPKRVFPPLFNRYAAGMGFGNHVDGALRGHARTGTRIRTDLSATLFLCAPEDYDGGELVIEDRFGTHQVKLPAGSMVLYPASSLHRVTPVTRGTRLASFFWIQSLVRDDAQRTLLFDLDMSIIQLGRNHPGHPSLVALTGVYHNLLRMWADP